jgi:hypothetical protein
MLRIQSSMIHASPTGLSMYPGPEEDAFIIADAISPLGRMGLFTALT